MQDMKSNDSITGLCHFHKSPSQQLPALRIQFHPNNNGPCTPTITQSSPFFPFKIQSFHLHLLYPSLFFLSSQTPIFSPLLFMKEEHRNLSTLFLVFLFSLSTISFPGKCRMDKKGMEKAIYIFLFCWCLVVWGRKRKGKWERPN